LENQKTRKWENGKVGKWENGKVEKWEYGKVEKSEHMAALPSFAFCLSTFAFGLAAPPPPPVLPFAFLLLPFAFCLLPYPPAFPHFGIFTYSFIRYTGGK
jgi:hypothetical protein